MFKHFEFLLLVFFHQKSICQSPENTEPYWNFGHTTRHIIWQPLPFKLRNSSSKDKWHNIQLYVYNTYIYNISYNINTSNRFNSWTKLDSKTRSVLLKHINLPRANERLITFRENIVCAKLTDLHQSCSHFSHRSDRILPVKKYRCVNLKWLRVHMSAWCFRTMVNSESVCKRRANHNTNSLFSFDVFVYDNVPFFNDLILKINVFYVKI